MRPKNGLSAETLRGATWPYAISAVASGSASLVFEVLWFYQARLAFGNALWATSVVLAGFMAGLGIGGLLAARRADRVENPGSVYLALEVAIAVVGVILVFALPGIGEALADLGAPAEIGAAGGIAAQGDVSYGGPPIARLAVALVLLTIAALPMGATLPVMMRVATAERARFGSTLSLLYGANIVGAVCGVLAAEWLLIGTFGIRGTAFFAAGSGLAAGALVWWASARTRPSDTQHESHAATLGATPRRVEPRLIGLLIAAGGSGLILLALEALWFRLLSLFVFVDGRAYAAMLASVLVGMALGSFIHNRFPRALSPAAIAFTAGALCIPCYAILPRLLSDDINAALMTGEVWRLALPLAMPVSIASGMLFPAIGDAARRFLPGDAQATGAVAASNTIGAAIGSLLATFILLPNWGLEASVFGMALIYGAVGLLCLDGTRAWRLTLASGSLWLIGILAFPHGLLEDQLLKAATDRYRLRPEDRVVRVEEGPLEFAIHLQYRAFGFAIHDRLVTGAFSMSANSVQARRYMELFAEIPYALHPAPKRALLVSYGLGSTAAALLREPELARLDVVDPSTTILSMSEGFKHPTGDPLKDDRVHVIVDDARHHLSTTSTRYDIITGEPPPPAAAGMAVLFNAETFEHMRERLRPGGFATWWLPLHSLTLEGGHSIVRAFCQAFPDCSLWNGSGLDLILVGSKDAAPNGPVSADRFSRAFRDPKRRNALASIGIGRPEQIGALFIADAPALDALTIDAPTLTDDDPHRLATPRTKAELPINLARRALKSAASRDLFESSPTITRLWPATLRANSLPFFRWEALLQRTLHDRAALEPNALGRVPAGALTEILGTPGLEPLALLLLGSDIDLQRIASQALKAERAPPGAFIQRATGDLARGYAAAAAEKFIALLGTPHETLTTRQLGALAICMSRDNKTARQFLRQKPEPTGKSRFVGIVRVIDAGCGSAAKPESSLTR